MERDASFVITARIILGQRLGLSFALGQHAIALVSGLLLSRAFTRYPFGDAVAPFVYVLVAVAVVLGFVVIRPAPRVALPVAGLLVVWAVPTLYSMALGSSWSGLTWFPVILAVVLVSGLSPAFLLGAVGLTVVEFAGTLVLLKVQMNVPNASGSVPYFLGFVGAVGAFVWQGAANRGAPGTWLLRVWAVLACLLAASGAWMALASGARAALLALAVGVVIGVGGALLHGRSGSRRLKRAAGLLLVTLLLVPVVDVGLTSFFAPGSRSTMIPVLTTRAAATQSELGASGGSFRTRLEYWKQAGNTMLRRPQGHGLGSYQHVNHAYQHEPMLWSASPHNFLALTAVETGLPGLLALLSVIALAAYRAFHWRPHLLAALAAAAVVLSLDIFSSQPIQVLLWWAVLGAALASGELPSRPVRPGAVVSARLLLLALVAVAGAAAVRFAVPCQGACAPLERYAGLPRLLSSELDELAAEPADPRWNRWGELYPMAFWLQHAHAEARRRAGDLDGYVELLQRFPYQSVDTYLLVARELSDGNRAVAIAACGLAMFFDGQTIWRDHRSSAEELLRAREELEAFTQASQGPKGEAACEAIGVERPLGL